MAEAWFDAEDFLLLFDGEEIVGYCWLKVEHGIGEFYVVGVSPERQGEGLGRRLVDAGLSHLSRRGIHTAGLYVEGDNLPALALYRSVGFTDHAVDVQYSTGTA
jgi:mycothiol synthase